MQNYYIIYYCRWQAKTASYIVREPELAASPQSTRLHSLTEQHFDARFYTKIAITFLLLIALTKCAYLLLASLASKNRVLYSEGRAYKREPKPAASPQSTTLHSTGNTFVKNGVTRTKSATATHVE